MGWTCTVRSKESEKIDKYQDLTLESQTCAHYHRSIRGCVEQFVVIMSVLAHTKKERYWYCKKIRQVMNI